MPAEVCLRLPGCSCSKSLSIISLPLSLVILATLYLKRKESIAKLLDFEEAARLRDQIKELSS